ncbi:MAG TPA: RyR domain-containing protein [Gemmatimonadales bacterium]|jgi:hypothetical protein|nr:RyR domain-containing protein [Gemmatimonadales bacterium]
MSGSALAPELALLSRRKRIALAGWFLATLALGTAGYLRYAREGGEAVSLWTALYHSAQLFILHAPHFERHVNLALELARWSAAILFGGTVYQVARQVFQSEFAALQRRRLSGHLIVGGLGRRALQCVRCERGKPRGKRRAVVVIDRAPAEDLAAATTKLGAHVLTGDVNDPAVLKAAGLARAAELWALCAEDSVNCETAVQAGKLLAAAAPRRAPLACNVHLSDIDLRVELQRYAAAAAEGTPLALHFFDLYDFEARRVLLHELPIDHDGIGVDERRQPHLVILGFARMGRSLAIRAAKLGHFANAARNPALRLRISVLDRAGAQGEAALLFRYPQFRSACELEVHTMDIESPAARSLLEGWCGERGSLTSLAVCFDDEARAVETALRLLPALETQRVRIAVRLAHRAGLGSMLERVQAHAAGTLQLKSFGRLDEGCCEAALEESAQERLARAIHADFVAQRRAEGRNAHDRSLAEWTVLEEDLRESNRQQADHVVIKLRTVGCEAVRQSDPRPALEGFEEAEVELLARMEHARWTAERRLANWSPGEKSVARRSSPYLVPWAELPGEVQEYDRAAVRGIPRLLGGIGMKVGRIQDG